MVKPLLILAICNLLSSCSIYSSSGRKDFESKSNAVALNTTQVKDCFYNSDLKNYFRWNQDLEIFENCENNNME